MKILAFDTAFAAVSACVARDGAVLAWRRAELARGHAEILLPMIGEVLAEAGLSARDMDRIATTLGPGHFTGLRAGLAAAQGLGLATGASLVGLTSFAVVRAGIEPSLPGERCLIAFDSKRAEAFVELDDEAPYAAVPDGFAPAGERFLVAGDRAAAFAEALVRAGKQARLAAGPALPDARALARLAATAAPATRLLPLYIHPPAITVPKRP
ncbi:MAG: tRNA (adenosine(37)-N6)-threonylcarbamoyltransferase complex dimerization subunit type 1 TsaB [Proteobacteria bacterium]|nr:tRNA (adenosine(37)-N6)-threonylcarbamoyltransferase complex dimerization subunit type 1 TsaB [Pseudomonadota bacterium]